MNIFYNYRNSCYNNGRKCNTSIAASIKIIAAAVLKLFASLTIMATNIKDMDANRTIKSASVTTGAVAVTIMDKSLRNMAASFTVTVEGIIIKSADML